LELPRADPVQLGIELRDLARDALAFTVDPLLAPLHQVEALGKAALERDVGPLGRADQAMSELVLPAFLIICHLGLVLETAHALEESRSLIAERVQLDAETINRKGISAGSGARHGISSVLVRSSRCRALAHAC